MTDTTLQPNLEPGTDSAQSLVLTPMQDLKGFLLHHFGRLLLFLITSTSVLAVFLIFFFVIKEAFPFFTQCSWRELFTSKSWYPQAAPPKFGAVSLMVGSLYVTVTALLFAVPLGILAALFLSDVVSPKIREIVKPIIEILAAIPSVAYGVFAILVLAPFFQEHLNFPTGANALTASLVLSVMALPTIISVAEDSISAVGRDLRAASYALGATRCETLFKVVLPAAHSGIIAAVILGMMRAVGETMVVWMAAGNANRIPTPWWNLSQSVRTITATIAGELGETPKDTSHYWALFALGLTLLLITFMLNMISEYFLASAKKKLGRA